MKRIVFATFGSLGDLHPYIALALELGRLGYRPAIVTTDIHRERIEHEGIDFAPMRPSASEMGDPAEVVRKVFHPSSGPEYLFRDLVMAHLSAAYEDVERACIDADMIVSHPLTFAARLVAEKRGLAWRSTVLSPLSLMSNIDPPLFASAPWLLWFRKLGVAPYRAVLELAKRTVSSWEQPLHVLRSELGLPPLSVQSQFAPEGNLALFSRVLAEPQPDWPPATIVCGFCRYDRKPLEPSRAGEYEAWLREGNAPIVFTLGSAVWMYASEFFVTAIEATRRLGMRALLITGQDPAQLEPAIASARMPPNAIRAYRYLPYSAVFPFAAVNVHQGGIGTVGQALAAGKPQLITPVALDQPDNARRVVRAGSALAIPFQKLTAKKLAAAVVTLTSSGQYAARAAEMAALVSSEEREERAVRLLAS